MGDAGGRWQGALPAQASLVPSGGLRGPKTLQIEELLT